MRHAMVSGGIALFGVLLFLCLMLVEVYVGLTLAGATQLILPWDW